MALGLFYIFLFMLEDSFTACEQETPPAFRGCPLVSVGGIAGLPEPKAERGEGCREGGPRSFHSELVWSQDV